MLGAAALEPKKRGLSLKGINRNLFNRTKQQRNLHAELLDQRVQILGAVHQLLHILNFAAAVQMHFHSLENLAVQLIQRHIIKGSVT